jgi:predicted ester cyclase
MAGSVVLSAEQNKDLAIKCFTAIHRRDADGLNDVLSPKWADEIRSWFSTGRAAWAGHWLEVVDMVAEDDRVWCRLRASGTLRNERTESDPAGRPWTSTSVWFLRIANDKIIEMEWLFDELGPMRQLGDIITPP